MNEVTRVESWSSRMCPCKKRHQSVPVCALSLCTLRSKAFQGMRPGRKSALIRNSAPLDWNLGCPASRTTRNMFSYFSHTTCYVFCYCVMCMCYCVLLWQPYATNAVIQRRSERSRPFPSSVHDSWAGDHRWSYITSAAQVLHF